MFKKAVRMMVFGLMLAVSGVFAQYVSINGYVRQYTPDPNDRDTIIGVTVTFVVTSPVPDTFTTTAEGNIGAEQGSYYYIDGIPKGSRGYIAFIKEHFRFETQNPRWIVSHYSLNCSTTVHFNVVAIKNYRFSMLNIWMLDSSSFASVTDSNQVNWVIINYYRDDTLKFIDTTKNGEYAHTKPYPADWDLTVTLNRNGFNFTQSGTLFRLSYIGDTIEGYYVTKYKATIQKPTRLTPSPNNQNSPNPTVFKWRKTPYATAYTLQVSTDKSFASSLVLKDTADTIYTLTTTPNTKYYWRLRTKIDTYFSDWLSDSFKTVSSTGLTYMPTVTSQTGFSVWGGVLSYTLAQTGPVQIRVYDLQGRTILAYTKIQNVGLYREKLNYAGRCIAEFKAGSYHLTAMGY
jgi:hypothetical protein